MTSTMIQPSLNQATTFADSFWDEQYKGVDIVLSRLRKSKDTCEQIKRLYELRASIEQDYGEKLLKLAQSSRIGEFEENTFAETLSRIPSIFETTARAHIDLAQQLKDHLELPLDGFLKDQRDIRKVEQQKIENSKQLKNLHETDVARAKEYYSNECKKLATLEKRLFELVDQYNDNNGDVLEDIYKIEKEIEEQKRMVAVADQVYQRSIDNLNNINEKWINDWTSSANQFQEMEIKRITYLRDTLWSFSNMMTTTLNIDEECCDRVRTALEITDVNKDITFFVQRYGTGTNIPAPSSYEILYHPTPIHLPSLLKAPPQESLPTNESSQELKSHRTSTILTNPDEELKSVDRQLKQLEVQGSRSDIEDDDDENQPLSGVTNNTDQSNGPVSTAIKEVEYMLNQNHEPAKTSEPVVHERQIASSPQSIADDFSTGIYNALGMDSRQELNRDPSHVELAPLSSETPLRSSFEQPPQQESKYKPMPNPNYSNHVPVVGVRTSSLTMKNHEPPVPVKDDDDEDEEEHEYHQRMPRPPPKDEKWMISSIRRPQQLPVRTLNAKIFDGTSSARSSMISPNHSMDQMETAKTEEEDQPYQPKVHRPVVPLTIDIPNAIPKQQQQQQQENLAHNAAQQVIAEGRRLSQMSPVPQKMDLQPQQQIDMMRYTQQNSNGPVEEVGIRPAPWQEDFNTDDQMVPNNQHYYMNGYHPPGNYPPGAPGPRGSSLKLTNQQQEQHYQQQQQQMYMQQQEEKKRFGNKKSAEPKPPKEPKSGRFSLGFFNKKDKKKEKEKEAAILETNFRPLSQQVMYNTKQPSLQELSDRKSNHSGSQPTYIPPPQQQQQQPPAPQQQPPAADYSRFIGFAKAQWPFEATIDGEMSFDMHEVLGIYRRQADGWWDAERLNTGQRGLIPGNYMVDAPTPSS